MSSDRSMSRRMVWFFVAVVFLSVAATTIQTSRMWAAEEKEAAAAAAPAAAGGEEKGEAPVKTKSYAWWIIESSGFIGLVILLLSIYFVATVSRLFFELRPNVVTPPEMLEQLDKLIEQRDFKSVFAVVKEDDSIFCRMLSTGIAELPNGLAEARDVMERVAESIHVELEKKISIMAVLGTLGPMIGLLGTLKGMIASFSVIAMSDVQLKASEVAGGISEALLLTFEGVGLSVPAIFFFSLFRNRVSALTTNASLEADQYLRRFAHAARVKPAGAAAAAPAGAAAAAPKPAK